MNHAHPVDEGAEGVDLAALLGDWHEIERIQAHAELHDMIGGEIAPVSYWPR